MTGHQWNGNNGKFSYTSDSRSIFHSQSHPLNHSSRDKIFKAMSSAQSKAARLRKPKAAVCWRIDWTYEATINLIHWYMSHSFMWDKNSIDYFNHRKKSLCLKTWVQNIQATQLGHNIRDIYAKDLVDEVKRRFHGLRVRFQTELKSLDKWPCKADLDNHRFDQDDDSNNVHDKSNVNGNNDDEGDEEETQVVLISANGTSKWEFFSHLLFLKPVMNPRLPFPAVQSPSQSGTPAENNSDFDNREPGIFAAASTSMVNTENSSTDEAGTEEEQENEIETKPPTKNHRGDFRDFLHLDFKENEDGTENWEQRCESKPQSPHQLYWMDTGELDDDTYEYEDVDIKPSCSQNPIENPKSEATAKPTCAGASSSKLSRWRASEKQKKSKMSFSHKQKDLPSPSKSRSVSFTPKQQHVIYTNCQEMPGATNLNRKMMAVSSPMIRNENERLPRGYSVMAETETKSKDDRFDHFFKFCAETVRGLGPQLQNSVMLDMQLALSHAVKQNSISD